MLSSAIYSDGFVGHKTVIDRLEALIEKGRLPHALLFCGPEGIGKLRAARWVAAAHLCPKFGCGSCPTCGRVLGSSHPDLLWLEAEEGRRDILIGQVRELMSAIATKSFEAGGKAAVIDGADRMNEESQNAFLKTLEEPPPGSIIILVSASPERLLPTIRSRCQRLSFGRLSEEELNRFTSLQGDLEPDFPLRLAEGSPGRLLRFLREDTGRVREILIDFIAAPSPPSPVRCTAALMAWAEQAAGHRQAVREKLRAALELFAGFFRDILVLKEGGGDHHLLNRDYESRIREASALYEPVGLYHAVQGVVEAGDDISSYVDPGLAVEKVLRIIREVRKRG